MEQLNQIKGFIAKMAERKVLMGETVAMAREKMEAAVRCFI
jgi:hypothetical protein